MKKNYFISVLAIIFCGSLWAQPADLPLKEWNANGQTPFIFYISGDGGFNSFSTDLCSTINKGGYQVTALNARSYFWNKKTPEQTASDIALYLKKIFTGRKDQQLVLIGYSFGADVMPFIVNKLPDSIHKKLVSVLLMAPSTSTDFEVHWIDILGGHSKRSMDVVAEVNKMNVPKTLVMMGEDDKKYFPAEDVRLKNFTTEILPGSHHFGGDTEQVATTLMKYFR